MAVGIVKWFDLEKGMGCIRPKDGVGEVIVHLEAVENAGLFALIEGEEVAFDPVRNKDLIPRAEHLEVLDK